MILDIKDISTLYSNDLSGWISDVVIVAITFILINRNTGSEYAIFHNIVSTNVLNKGDKLQLNKTCNLTTQL